jgi:hypothetical protein
MRTSESKRERERERERKSKREKEKDAIPKDHYKFNLHFISFPADNINYR